MLNPTSGGGMRVSESQNGWTEVPHTRTGEVVGWLRRGEFRPVEKGLPSELETPRESRETKAVMRWLQKDHGLHMVVGDSFPMDSLERYANSAKKWLKDRSTLKTKTIEQADYSVAYEFFREKNES
jgi:hypothetical protein